MNNTQVSTFVDYSVDDVPRNLELVKGQWVECMDSYGSYNRVQIVGIRMIEGKPVVYYRTPISRKHWFSLRRWQYAVKPVDQFKTILMDLGSVSSVLLSGSSENNS